MIGINKSTQSRGDREAQGWKLGKHHWEYMWEREPVVEAKEAFKQTLCFSHKTNSSFFSEETWTVDKGQLILDI